MRIMEGLHDRNEVQKGLLLKRMGLSRELDLKQCQIDELIKVARIACLDHMEVYFGVENTHNIISPRNEAAALSLLLQKVETTSGGLLTGALSEALYACSNSTSLCNNPLSNNVFRTRQRRYADKAQRCHRGP